MLSGGREDALITRHVVEDPCFRKRILEDKVKALCGDGDLRVFVVRVVGWRTSHDSACACPSWEPGIGCPGEYAVDVRYSSKSRVEVARQSILKQS